MSAKGLAQFFNAFFFKRCGLRQQTQASGFFEFFQRGHGLCRAVVPNVRAQARKHDRVQRQSLVSVAGNRLFDGIGRRHIAWLVVRNQRHMTDFHHKVGRDRCQQFRAQRGLQRRVFQA